MMMSLVHHGLHSSSFESMQHSLGATIGVACRRCVLVGQCPPCSSYPISAAITYAFVVGCAHINREIYHTKRMQRIFSVLWSSDAKYVMSGSDEMNIR